MRLPIWCVILACTTVPAIIVGCISIGLLHWGSQNQVDHMYQLSVSEIQRNIQTQVSEYFDVMRMVSSGIDEIEPEFKGLKMPVQGGFDPKNLIRYMNTLVYRHKFESIGIIVKASLADKRSKSVWEIAHGFGCPEFIYGRMDDTSNDRYIGQCAGFDGTISSAIAYNGSDFGLKPEEQLLLDGTISQTFLPIFPLLTINTLTYAKNLRDQNGNVYGFSFAQKGLAMIDEYFESIQLGTSGVAYIYERTTSNLVTCSVPKQTSRPDPNSDWNALRVQATDADDSRVSESAKSIVEHFGSLEEISVQQNLIHNGLLISVNPYRTDDGIDWIIVTVDQEGEVFNPVRKYSAIGIGSSAGFMLVMIICATIFSCLFARSFRRITFKLKHALNPSSFQSEDEVHHFTKMPSISSYEMDEIEKQIDQSVDSSSSSRNSIRLP